MVYIMVSLNLRRTWSHIYICTIDSLNLMTFKSAILLSTSGLYYFYYCYHQEEREGERRNKKSTLYSRRIRKIKIF